MGNRGADYEADDREFDSIETGKQDITNETYVEATLSSDISINANDYTNIVNTTDEDNKGEFSSQAFSPDETNRYIVFAHVQLEPGSAGDRLSLRLRNTTDTTDTLRVEQEATGSGRHQLHIADVIQLSSTKTYEIQARDFDSSAVIKTDGTNPTRVEIVRSVVQP